MDTATLWEQYHKRIFTRLLCLTHNRQTAEDLLQETYIKAMRYPPREDGNLYGWLFLIATNLARDEMRKCACRIQAMSFSTPIFDDSDETYDVASVRDDPGRYVDACDLQRQAFARLNKPGQQALLDYHIHGKEIDIQSVYDARRNLHYIYQRMEQRIEQEAGA
jgi:DNA-directed RNA polymerase specialized sigma24 family protein